MYNHWSDDQKKAMECITLITSSLNINYPIKCIEHTDNEVLKWLDMFAGIDWMINKKNIINGIAVRVQWMPFLREPFNTFTIRFERHTGTKTEFEKRID